LPNSNSGGDAAPIMQGDSEVKDPEEEDLDADADRAPGVSASEKASQAARPGGGANAGGEVAPVLQGSSVDTMTPPMEIKFNKEEKEALEKILSEAGISADTQTKLIETFEAAVSSRVEAELETASDSLVEAVAELGEMNATKLHEAVDAYLDYVVEQWMEANELAVEQGLRTEITESFIDSLKTVFAEHFIEVPEEKYDVLGKLQEQNKELETKLNESVAKEVDLAKENSTLKRRQIVERVTRDMVVTDAEKLAKLVEDVEFDTEDAFEGKVQMLRERHFSKTPSTNTASAGTVEDAMTEVPSGLIGAAVAAISSGSKKFS